MDLQVVEAVQVETVQQLQLMLHLRLLQVAVVVELILLPHHQQEMVELVVEVLQVDLQLVLQMLE